MGCLHTAHEVMHHTMTHTMLPVATLLAITTMFMIWHVMKDGSIIMAGHETMGKSSLGLLERFPAKVWKQARGWSLSACLVILVASYHQRKPHNKCIYLVLKPGP